jgi:hypothetical protein
MMLFLVARDQPDLYLSLQREFADEPDIEVMLDRRLGQRRRERLNSGPERRRSDRRARPNVDLHLRSIGWAVVHPDRPPI